MLLFFLYLSICWGLEPSWPDIQNPYKKTRDGKRDAALIVAIGDYSYISDIQGTELNGKAWQNYFIHGRGIPPQNVEVLFDQQASKAAMEEALKEAIQDVSKGGTLWFVFIGHGTRTSQHKSGLLVSVDARESIISIERQSLSIKNLLRKLNLGKQKQTVAVIDACFSSQLVPNLQPFVVQQQPRTKSNMILLSAAEKYAGPLPGVARPAFSYLILGGLRGWADQATDQSDGKISAGELIDYSRTALDILLDPGERNQRPTINSGANRKTIVAKGKEQGPNLTAIKNQTRKRRSLQKIPTKNWVYVHPVQANHARLKAFELHSLTEEIREAAHKAMHPTYEIISPEIVQQLRRNQQKPSIDFTQQTALNISRSIHAKYAIQATVQSIGKTFKIRAKLYDIESTKTLAIKSKNVQSATMLMDKTQELAQELLANHTQKSVRKKKTRQEYVQTAGDTLFLEALLFDFHQNKWASEKRIGQLYAKACRQKKRLACLYKNWHHSGGASVVAAKSEFPKRCTSGDPIACLVMGWIYTQDTPPNGKPFSNAAEASKGAQYFQRSCQIGLLRGCVELARLEYGGIGIHSNPRAARTRFEEACQQGNGRACVALGWMAANGKSGYQINTHKAFGFYRKSCDDGEAEGCHALAVLYHDGKAPPLLNNDRLEDHVLTLYNRACKQGYMQSCNNAATLFQHSTTNQDKVRAVQLFKVACDGGSNEACNNYAGMQMFGEGVTKNCKAAHRLLIRLCQDNVAESCQTGGELFMENDTYKCTIRKNPVKAKEMLEKACSLNAKYCLHPSR